MWTASHQRCLWMPIISLECSKMRQELPWRSTSSEERWMRPGCFLPRRSCLSAWSRQNLDMIISLIFLKSTAVWWVLPPRMNEKKGEYVFGLPGSYGPGRKPYFRPCPKIFLFWPDAIQHGMICWTWFDRLSMIGSLFLRGEGADFLLPWISVQVWFRSTAQPSP